MSDDELTGMGMKVEGRAVFIADVDALRREVMVLNDLATITEVLDIIQKHTVVISDARLIPLQTLMAAAIPDELVNHASDELRRSVGLAVLQKVATLTLSKEGEWPE